MILRIRHKGLDRFYRADDASGINPQFADKLRRMLTTLDASSEPQDMNKPGYRLHQLKGERKGQWAVWVSGNWRLVFTFSEADATDVDLVDYH
jgi:proteic killer suppression protein